MSPVEMLMVAATVASLVVLVRHVSHLADDLIRAAEPTVEPPGDDPGPEPTDPLPPPIDWGDFAAALELWALTNEEHA